MTLAQIAAREQNAARRAIDLKPAVRMIAADVWAVESARRDVTYIVRASVEGVRCSCKAADQGLPCYHVSAALMAASAAIRSEAATADPRPAA